MSDDDDNRTNAKQARYKAYKAYDPAHKKMVKFAEQDYTSTRKIYQQLITPIAGNWTSSLATTSFSDWLRSLNLYVDMTVKNFESGERSSIKLPWTPVNVLATIWTAPFASSQKQVLQEEYEKKSGAMQIIRQSEGKLLKRTGEGLNWQTPMSEIFSMTEKYMNYIDTADYISKNRPALDLYYLHDTLKVGQQDAKDVVIADLTKKLEACQEDIRPKKKARVQSTIPNDTYLRMPRQIRNLKKKNYKTLSKYSEE